MKNNGMRINKISSHGRAKVKKAEISYDKIQKEIEPFIRKRKTSQYSTAGKWKVLTYET